MIRVFTIGAAMVVFAGTAACTDLAPLQAQINDLKQQVTTMASNEDGLRSAVDKSTENASRALTAAEQSQSRAEAAAAAASAAQQSCDAINDKIDRMFKKSLSK